MVSYETLGNVFILSSILTILIPTAILNNLKLCFTTPTQTRDSPVSRNGSSEAAT